MEDAGSSMSGVVKMTVYVQNLEDFDRVNGIYTRYFPEPQPARTTVGANLRNGRLVEMDAVALLRQ